MICAASALMSARTTRSRHFTGDAGDQHIRVLAVSAIATTAR
jgi:hypothetical protein